MDCVLTRRKMNMPMLMIQYMLSAYKNGKGYFLPYGMWLTKVFKAFGVDLSDDVCMQNEYKTPFNEKTIENSLGYTFNGQQWIKRGIKRGNKRADPPPRPSSKISSSDAEKLQEATMESLVIQEMLRRLHPDLFSPTTMEDIRAVALKEMTKRYEMVGNISVGEGSKRDEDEEDEGATTKEGEANHSCGDVEESDNDDGYDRFDPDDD